MSNLNKRLANIFKGNPKAKKLYYTEDEQIFTKENKADAHASILGGKRKVSEVDRDSLAKATKSTEDNKAKEPAKPKEPAKAKGKGSKKGAPKKDAPKEPAKEDKTQKEAKASDADEAKAAEKAATDNGSK